MTKVFESDKIMTDQEYYNLALERRRNAIEFLSCQTDIAFQSSPYWWDFKDGIGASCFIGQLALMEFDGWYIDDDNNSPAFDGISCFDGASHYFGISFWHSIRIFRGEDAAYFGRSDPSDITLIDVSTALTNVAVTVSEMYDWYQTGIEICKTIE